MSYAFPSGKMAAAVCDGESVAFEEDLEGFLAQTLVDLRDVWNADPVLQRDGRRREEKKAEDPVAELWRQIEQRRWSACLRHAVMS